MVLNSVCAVTHRTRGVFTPPRRAQRGSTIASERRRASNRRALLREAARSVVEVREHCGTMRRPERASELVMLRNHRSNGFGPLRRSRSLGISDCRAVLAQSKDKPLLTQRCSAA